MPWLSKKEKDGLDRALRLLRRENEDLKAEARTQTDSASRLAGSVERIEANAQGARKAVQAAYQELRTKCDRQEQHIARLTRANQALQGQLDDALGYTPEQRAAINSGTGEPGNAVTA